MRIMMILSILSSILGGRSQAASLQVGSPAPTFQTQTDKGEPFSLEHRQGKWSVLYFYPKDDTPGCTKQACAFRDSIEMIRNEGAEVFGISKDSVESHKKFVDKFKLNFPLLADPDGKIIKSYGVSGTLGFAKRWTFIVDPQLKVRAIQEDVNPTTNAADVANTLKELKKAH
jgi:thioredoxin-dependent peroxiredoxin